MPRPVLFGQRGKFRIQYFVIFTRQDNRHRRDVLLACMGEKMVRKFVFAASVTALVAGASFLAAPLISAPALAAAEDAASDEDAAVAALQAQIEQLIIANAGDADALAAAIEALVEGAANSEAAAKAVLAAVSNPKSDEARAALAGNSGLKDAAGKGLGAAIAMIGKSNPTVAANMQAIVVASGDTGFQASVTNGTEVQTASILSQQNNVDTNVGQDKGIANGMAQDSTPETPASAN